MGNRWVIGVAMLGCLARLPLQGMDPTNVKRGGVERQGRAWVERDEVGSPVRDGGRLVLRLNLGSVTIQTGESNLFQAQVILRCNKSDEAEARRLFANYRLSVRPIENGGVYVTGESAAPSGGTESFGVDLKLQVPQRFSLDLETKGGDISVESPLQGDARLTTAGGDIHTADVSGPAKIATAVGNITVGNMGSHVEARTAGGNVRVGNVKGDATLETSGGEIETGQVEGSLRIASAGGDVVIGGASGQVMAQTAGGQIQIGQSSGSVRAETAGGSIRLRGARGRVVAETAGGSIDLLSLEGAVRASTPVGRILAQWMGNKPAFGASDLETSMGDVFVYLPIDLSVTIDAAIARGVGHEILCDFPQVKIQGAKRDEFAGGTIRGQGALNGGGQVLRIRTTSGNIEIRKLDGRSLKELQSREDTDQRP